MRLQSTLILLAGLLCASAAEAVPTLEVTADGLQPFQPLPADAASCRFISPDRVAPGPNVSLGLHWSHGPQGTRSYVVIMFDRDVPVDHTQRDQRDVRIPVAAARREFTHWLIADLSPERTSLAPGADTTRYHGPCPPWNDEKSHHYVLRIFALDTPRLTLPADYRREDLERAMRGHVLASGEVVQTYTENPDLVNAARRGSF